MKKIFLFFILIFAVTAILAPIALAQGFRFEVSLPSLPLAPSPGSSLVGYISYIFVFGILLAGFLALGYIILGGLQYVLAAGNVGKVESAKSKIEDALIGLGIILVAYLLLRTINPDLVNLKSPSLTPLSIPAANFSQNGGIVPGAGAPGTTLIQCGSGYCDSTQICGSGNQCTQAAPPISP